MPPVSRCCVQREIVAATNLGHDDRGGWAMPSTRAHDPRTPLNETRIWDYISFAILVMLSLLVYTWLEPH
jgi:hypothetical protein